MRRGLTRRTMLGSTVLALLVGAAFAVLVRTIGEDRDSAQLATRSVQVIAAASVLERLLLDLETGQRGYLIGHRERFLQPWREALALHGSASRTLLSSAAGVDGSEDAARHLVAAVDAYINTYSIPLVDATRRGDPAAGSVQRLEDGKRRVDAIRRMFDGFIRAQRRVFAAREQRADADARRAVVVATAGLGGSILLVLAFGTYLTRAIALPVRRAADMAGRLAAGDLATRLPETGTGEVATLERSFNTMAASLEASRDELRQLAEEQAALRRVATLVARAVPPDEVFDAVTEEVRQLLGAVATRLLRYDPDGRTVTMLGGYGLSTPAFEAGTRFRLEGDSITAEVQRTGRAARRGGSDDAPGMTAAMLRENGLRSAVATPVTVGGQLWGVMVAAFAHEATESESEERMAQFTELVATALANTQSRADLAASRARVVATADETRRRIERDLHDGAQQRLVHAVITLKLALRTLVDRDASGVELVEEALEHTERATAELRDLAHGILPPALTRGGLKAGIETLVSRLRPPVTLDVTSERFPAALEATAYFIVAEALTNTSKHAQAHSAHVSASVENGALRVQIGDDGVGGARLGTGSGLVGLRDRAAAHSGELLVQSPTGGGTTITAKLPIPSAPS